MSSRGSFTLLPGLFLVLILQCGLSLAAQSAPGQDPVLGSGTAEGLDTLVQAWGRPLPRALTALISTWGALGSQGQGFARLWHQAMAMEEYLVLVDKTHPLDPQAQIGTIEALKPYSPPLVLNRDDLALESRTLKALLDMSAAARKEGITLDISSSWRSYGYQERLFQRNVRQSGYETARRESAMAGTSQHQLGTALDFGSVTPAFGQSAAGSWLARHAWEYGFSLSYPQGMEHFTGYIHEAWHYRYLGPAACRLQREYFDDNQQLMLEFIHRYRQVITQALGGARR